MKLRSVPVLFALLSLCLIYGCTRPEDQSPTNEPAIEAARISVCVSIPPQAFFVERIGGERVSVVVLVGPGQSPATYEPTPSQIAQLDSADVYFRIGVPFEDALLSRVRSSMPGKNIVDLREGIQLRQISERGGHGHSHGREDPHTWLDPRLAAEQARTIQRELARLDPEGQPQYNAALEVLLEELEAVRRQAAEMLAPVRGRAMVVFHPAFGYFADAYGLEQVAIELEGREPAPRELERVIDDAKWLEARAIFVQPEFATASAEAVAKEIGAEIVRIDPLARDYLDNHLRMAREVAEALEAAEDERED